MYMDIKIIGRPAKQARHSQVQKNTKSLYTGIFLDVYVDVCISTFDVFHVFEFDNPCSLYKIVLIGKTTPKRDNEFDDP